MSAADLPPDESDLDQDEIENVSDISFDFEARPDAIKAGVAAIQRVWDTLPNSPGVYRMLDKNGELLYVGKAKNLKNRVATYARGQGHSNRIIRMIAETASMECIITATETEALLLEANLIKKLKPRYNVLLRDDKSLPYILLALDHPAPQLTKHRGGRNRKGDYYGPFANVWAVTRTMNVLQRAFLLRVCTDSYYENRTRPCLLYQIKRCSGPCTGEISHADYAELAKEARDFLSGRSGAVKERLSKDMQEASEKLDFENAARLRDRLAALSALQSSQMQGINTRQVEEADIFAIDEQAGQFCVEVFFFRNWQNWGNRAYFPRADKTMSLSEVLSSFIAQFYDNKPAPRCVLLSHPVDDQELLEEALSSRMGSKIELCHPKRGEKKALVEQAVHNAREALGRQLADKSSQRKLMQALQQAFQLEQAPRRIEVYDNSHISGTNAVGAMIVAGEGGFMKTHYRTFTIKSDELVPGDDYGMMREVIERRFARLAKEHPQKTDRPIDHNDFPAWPDLVLIDGGKGQLDAASDIFETLGIQNVTLVGIAKGRDRDAGRESFFMRGKPSFKLPPRDPALYFVQRLRDEAHRFAIGTHRAKRKKAFTKSPLDDIVGIGPARKRALLHHFGTVKAIERASLDDLIRTPGINAASAKIVHNHFRDG